jgi:carbon monoxide dehydrogenase subunit G
VRVEREIDLPVTPEEAWTVLTDWERQADWMLDADRVEVVSERRDGTGVRLAVRTLLFGIPAFTEPMEVTAWEPPRELGIRHGGPVRGAGRWCLEPLAGGTRFVWTEQVSLRVPLVGDLAARLYAPVMRRLMGRAMAGLRASLIARGPVR